MNSMLALEEMIRTMMEDELVHYDAINKLWQVYNVYVCSDVGSPIARFC